MCITTSGILKNIRCPGILKANSDGLNLSRKVYESGQQLLLFLGSEGGRNMILLQLKGVLQPLILPSKSYRKYTLYRHTSPPGREQGRVLRDLDWALPNRASIRFVWSTIGLPRVRLPLKQSSPRSQVHHRTTLVDDPVTFILRLQSSYGGGPVHHRTYIVHGSEHQGSATCTGISLQTRFGATGPVR